MMTTCNSQLIPQTPRRRGRRWSIGAAILFGVILGAALMGTGFGGLGQWLGGPDGGADVLALPPATMAFKAGDGPYTYIPFRRHLWVIHHPTDKVQFFMFPSTEENPIEPSKVVTIDRNDFPVDQVEFRISDTNVTSYLWLLNPVTGKARYYKAQRDGKIEPSDLLDVTRVGG